MMLSIRCPICEDMQFLVLVDWEYFLGELALGQYTRIGLVCPGCHNEFVLQVSLGQVITEG